MSVLVQNLLDCRLAIVIPAYKEDYLFKCLNSIANQTDKRFVVYIGNDCSPYDLEKIVSQFTDSINIVYKKYDENLGGSNLVSHWNRCISLIGNEDWIWLFSDDDEMQSDCVESFYKGLESDVDTDIFRFNINVIDSSSNVVHSEIKFSKIVSSQEYLIMKLSGKIKSYVVEYIFKRTDDFEFIDFPIAWYSDVATIMSSGFRSNIYTLPNGNVFWRRSDVNISPNYNNINIFQQKIAANYLFFKWILSNKFDEQYNYKVLLLLSKSFSYEFGNFRSKSIYSSLKEIDKFIFLNEQESNLVLSKISKLKIFVYFLYIRLIKPFLNK